MSTSDLYTRYHRAIHRLSLQPIPTEQWRKDLDELIRQFEMDAAEIDPREAQSTRDELCGQLEQEALRTTGPRRGAVLSAAVKGLEQVPLSLGR